MQRESRGSGHQEEYSPARGKPTRAQGGAEDKSSDIDDDASSPPAQAPEGSKDASDMGEYAIRLGWAFVSEINDLASQARSVHSALHASQPQLSERLGCGQVYF